MFAAERQPVAQRSMVSRRIVALAEFAERLADFPQCLLVFLMLLELEHAGQRLRHFLNRPMDEIASNHASGLVTRIRLGVASENRLPQCACAPRSGPRPCGVWNGATASIS